MSGKRVVLLVAIVLALVPMSALADTLDFSILPGASGSISYAGGAAPLVGTNIVVDSVTDLTTGFSFDLGDGACSLGPGTCFSGPGLLNFMTGPSTGPWTFGAGGPGSISITAPCIDADMDDAQDCSDDLLASGALGPDTWLKGSISSASVLFSGGTFHLVVALANDQKDPNLLTLFGITPPPSAWTSGLSQFFLTSVPKSTGAAFTSSALGSGDVLNTPVPEPATLTLLGSGLIGLAALVRSRKARKS